MSGWLVTGTMIVVMVGLTAGDAWRLWKNHQREMAAIDARAQAHKARMDSRLSEMLTEIDQEVKQFKSRLKTKSKGGK